jgi:hypothetical protein
MPSSPRNLKAAAWGWRSAVPSWNRMVAGCGRHPTTDVARRFISLCQPQSRKRLRQYDLELLRTPSGGREVSPANPTGSEFSTVVLHDMQKCFVGRWTFCWHELTRVLKPAATTVLRTSPSRLHRRRASSPQVEENRRIQLVGKAGSGRFAGQSSGNLSCQTGIDLGRKDAPECTNPTYL